MTQPKILLTTPRRWQAAGGILFALCYFAGDFIVNSLATVQLPMPGAPTAEIVRYYTSTQPVVLGLALFQILSALGLLVFVGGVVAFVRQQVGTTSRLPVLAQGGGVLAGVFLLTSAALALILRPVAASENLALVDLLRELNFRTGGTLHVVALGLFIGATSLATRATKALPGWINWWGMVTAVVAILSLLSFAFFYASLFILLGRLLGFVWCIAVAVVFLWRKSRLATTGDDRLVLT